MASSYEALTAEQVRLNYRKQYVASDSLTEPTIVDAIPGDADGLMPIGKINADLRVEIPLFTQRPLPGLPFTNTLYLEWLPEGSNQYLLLAEEEIPDSTQLPDEEFPLERVIPLSVFANYEGKFQYRYRVKNWNDSGQRMSLPVPVTIDRIGPIRPATPQSINVVEPLITTTVLDRDNGVKCIVPDFVEDKKDFVRVVVGLMERPPESETEFPSLVVYDALLPASREVLLPKSYVTTIGSKLQYIVYYLFDKAGNRSERSYSRHMQVALGELPSGLQPCEVPLAADGLIDRADAAVPTKVHIRQYNGWETGDGIVISWGNQELGRTTVGAHLPFDLTISVPWSRLSGAYDFLLGGVQSIAVDYKVYRGDYPTSSPSSIPVAVDLDIPGPENPDPEPVNPDLDVIRFLSSEGSSTELTEDDIGNDAEGFVNLYDDPEVGDTLTLYYNGRAISSPPYVVDGSESANQEIPFIIPWRDIELTPVMTGLKMYYTLTRAGFNNPQESDRTTIDVVVEVVRLPDPVFPGFLINCNSLVEEGGQWGIKIHIPPSSYLTRGVLVKFQWQTYEAIADTPFPGIPMLDGERSVSPQEEQNGMDWFVSYDTYLKPTYGNGNNAARGKAQYYIPVRGVPVPSELVEAYIGVFEVVGPGNDHCVIPRP